jgi:DIL domain
MFVFQEADLDNILSVVITTMTPTRSPSQKPVPANLLFLAARYAHYHSSPELLEILLSKSFAAINTVVEVHQWDMTMLAFWISNTTLLLHYLKKDAGLVDATTKYQLALSEVIQEIFILIIRDAERRMDRSLDKAILEYESIPGFEDVTFQNEWKLFRSRNKPRSPEPLEKRFRPPSPKRKAQVAPRNITSLLSSTLFVLELYDVHSVIVVQVIAQLFYWLGCEIFNRILDSRKYLARTKAMQIRMNISVLEDWALANNRKPEHYEGGETTISGESAVEAARRHLEPVHQLLQWLQVVSGIGEDFEALIGTVQQLPRLNAQQLIFSAKNYRAEVGENNLPKSAMKYLTSLQEEKDRRKGEERKLRLSQNQRPNLDEGPVTPSKPPKSPQPQGRSPGDDFDDDEDGGPDPDNLFFDPAHTLAFTLPSSTDMLVSYGAGFGGKNRERERKYIPTVPPEFLDRLNFGGNSTGGTKYDVDEEDAEDNAI